MRVIADRSRCMGLGNCEIVAPGVFEVHDDGAVHVLDAEVNPDRLGSITAAIDGCPTEALSLTDE